jgi:outer membrane protein TolC
MSRLPKRLRAAGGLALLVFVLPSCRSAAGWREQADHDVAALVRSRRAKLGIGDGSFTIEPPSDSLRQVLLRGQGGTIPPLTFVQCLSIAAENNRDYRTREEQLYLAALDLTLERWNFGVQEKGVAAASVDGLGDTAEDAAASGALTLSKVLGSGAAITGLLGLNLSRNLTTGDSWNPVSVMGLAITQPLLRGAGPTVTLEPLTQAERNLVYAVRSFERYRRTFAFDVATGFYALLQQQDSVKNQEMNFENLKKLSERNAALAEAGRLDDVQAGQAKQDELRSKDDLQQGRARLEIVKDQFKGFLGLPPQVDLSFDSQELERLADQDHSPLDVDEEKAAQLALSTRLDHLNIVDAGEDSVRHVTVAEDALRAGLSVGATWNNASQVGKPGTFNFQDSTWSLSAALDLPLDRIVERNAYRAAIIAEEEAHRNVESSIDSIRTSLRDEVRETIAKFESWNIQKSAVEVASRQVESTDLKLQAGRAITRDLLDAQAALLEARNAASSALVTYALSRLALFRDLELLRVDEHGIHVDAAALPVAHPGADPGKQAGAPAHEPEEAGA